MATSDEEVVLKFEQLQVLFLISTSVLSGNSRTSYENSATSCTFNTHTHRCRFGKACEEDHNLYVLYVAEFDRRSILG